MNYLHLNDKYTISNHTPPSYELFLTVSVFFYCYTNPSVRLHTYSDFTAFQFIDVIKEIREIYLKRKMI